MVDLEIKTGDLDKWAAKMESKGADFAAEIVKKAKRNLEKHRKQRKIKFEKIRRKRSGVKRFAIQKTDAEAELLKTAGEHFSDIFKEK